MDPRREILERAVGARTMRDALDVREMIVADAGARYERPIGDIWNNLGPMSTTGSFDHKLIENVTNMQDAVVARHAMARCGDLAKVPYTRPHEAAKALLGGVRYEEIAQKVRVDFYES